MPPKKLLEIKNNSVKLWDTKLIYRNFFTFLYTNNELEREIRKTTYLQLPLK